MMDLTLERNEKCHAIIHSAAAATGAIGASLAQLPLADTIPITAIQIGMIISLGKVFDKELTESSAKALLTGFAASKIGKEVVAVCIGWVPMLGNAIKATTASGITEAIGWSVVKYFENQEEQKLKEEKKNFEIGVKAGEKGTKEKYNNLFEKVKGEKYYYITLIRIIFYLNENKLDVEIEQKIRNYLELTSEDIIKNIINPEIQEIYITSFQENLNKIKYYLTHLSKEAISLIAKKVDEFGCLNNDTESKRDKLRLLKEIIEGVNNGNSRQNSRLLW